MIQAVRKIFEVLEFMDSESWIPLRQLAAAAQLSRSTLCNLLKTLEASGYVENNGTGSYRIGRRFLELGRPSPRKSETEEHAMESCISLAEATGESAVVATLSQRRIVVVAQAKSSRSGAVKFPTYRNLSFWRSTSGRILLAFLPQEERRMLTRVIGFPGHLWENARNDDELEALLKPIRESGVSVMNNRTGRFTAISRPFFDGTGALCGGIGMTVEHSRFYGQEERIDRELRRAAENLSDLNRECNITANDWRKK